MKAYKIIAQISLGLVVMFIGSCTNKFEEINTDPNRGTVVPTPNILTMVQHNIAFYYYDSWQGLRMNGVIGQQWVQRTYTEEDRYDFAGRTGTVNNFFNITYLYSELANKIISINENNPGDALVYGDNNMQIATIRILKAWLIYQNARTFGDVPYTEANDVTNILKPKYDKQDFIFKDLLRELKEVNTILQSVKQGWTKGDILLGGSPEKWRRFGNSLRLSIAMNMCHVEPALSASEADAAIADGVMRDNGDNAVFRFIRAGAPDESPKYDTYKSRHDFVPSWQFVNLLHGRNDDNIGFVNPFNGIVDPRFIQIVQSPADQAAGLKPRYDAVPIGLANSDNNNVWAALAPKNEGDPDTRIYYGPTQGRLDNVLPKPIQAAAWSTFMDYTNVALFMAERRGNDRDLFEKAVQASMDVWGVPEDDAKAYLTAVMAKFDAADSAGKYEMIITQKYIHNFAHFDQESVFEYRRTEYPKSVVLPGQRTGGTYMIGSTERTYTFEPLPYHGGSKSFLQRMLYPTDEGRFNKDNLEAAKASMGGDTQSIPLYYSKGYKK